MVSTSSFMSTSTDMSDFYNLQSNKGGQYKEKGEFQLKETLCNLRSATTQFNVSCHYTLTKVCRCFPIDIALILMTPETI